MVRTPFAACLFAAAAVVPAWAQSTPAPAPSAGAGANQAAPAPSADPGRFLEGLGAGQWRVSRLIGVNIYGFEDGKPNDRDKIGDVSDVILDRNGRAETLVIGVGGFLGIGEKAIAVPFTSVEWRLSTRPHNRPDGLAARTDATPEPTGAGGAPASGAGGGSAADATASTGTDRAEVNQGYPDRGYIRMSRGDLQNAPTFRYADEAGRDAARPGNPAPGATPRP